MSMKRDEQSEERMINLQAAVGILLDYKLLVSIITTLCIIGALIYLRLTPPVYQSDNLIQIESKKSGIAGIEKMLDMSGREPEAVTEIELIRSRFVIGKAVDHLDLTIDAKPKYYPYIGNYKARIFERGRPGQIAPAPNYPNAAKYNWGGAQIHIAEMEVEKKKLNVPFTLIVGTDGEYQLMFGEQMLILTGKVGEKAENNGVTLLVDQLTGNPGTEFWVTRRSRLQTINSVRGGVMVTEKGRRTGIVSLTMMSTDPEYANKVLDEVAMQYQYQNIERTSAEAANSLRFVREQLPQLREDMTRATAALNEYQVGSKSVDISTETRAVLDQIVKADTSLSEMKLKQVDIASRFTREHPSYQILLSQMKEVEDKKKEYEKKIESLPVTQQTLLRLQRDMDVSMRIYTQLLTKEQELDVVRAGTVGNIRIIDVAESRRVGPKPTMILMMAIAIGFFSSACLAWGHVALTRGVENPEDIERLGLPVNSIIPYSELQAQSERGRSKSTLLPLLSLSHPTDPAVEAIRTLRTSIYFIMEEMKKNIVMISGPSPLVGKTFVSANLAVAMAQADKKVLLIDADMRKGYMHCYFDVNLKNVGLSSVLQKKATLKDSIVRTSVENLDFMSRGPIPENPSELLLSPMLAAMFKQLSANYDFVIVDTPPIMAVADALIVSKLAGGNFIVSRFSKNPLGEVLATMKRFESNGIKLNGAILNASQRRSLANYGYHKYAYGNYTYSYASDSNDEHDTKRRSSLVAKMRATKKAFLGNDRSV